MKLRINPLVVNDLKAIRDYISEDNPEIAVKTVNEIYSLFETIQTFSNIGADLLKRVRFKTDKYMICENYIILYKLDKDSIEIYRVVNRYQDIMSIIFN